MELNWFTVKLDTILSTITLEIYMHCLVQPDQKRPNSAEKNITVYALIDIERLFEYRCSAIERQTNIKKNRQQKSASNHQKGGKACMWHGWLLIWCLSSYVRYSQARPLTLNPICRAAQWPAGQLCSHTELLQAVQFYGCMDVQQEGGKEKQTCRQMKYYPSLPQSVLSPPSVRKKHM